MCTLQIGCENRPGFCGKWLSLVLKTLLEVDQAHHGRMYFTASISPACVQHVVSDLSGLPAGAQCSLGAGVTPSPQERCTSAGHDGDRKSLYNDAAVWLTGGCNDAVSGRWNLFKSLLHTHIIFSLQYCTGEATWLFSSCPLQTKQKKLSMSLILDQSAIMVLFCLSLNLTDISSSDLSQMRWLHADICFRCNTVEKKLAFALLTILANWELFSL